MQKEVAMPSFHGIWNMAAFERKEQGEYQVSSPDVTQRLTLSDGLNLSAFGVNEVSCAFDSMVFFILCVRSRKKTISQLVSYTVVTKSDQEFCECCRKKTHSFDKIDVIRMILSLLLITIINRRTFTTLPSDN